MKRNKHNISATVSPLTEKQLDALVGSHHLFSSRGDVNDYEPDTRYNVGIAYSYNTRTLNN